MYLRKKFLVDIFYVLLALELVLAYFYTLDLFKPSYVILFRGATWVRVYKLGLSNQGFYALLPLLAVSLALGMCAYKAGGFRAIKPSKLACYVLAALTVASCLPLLYWVAYTWSPEPLLDCGFSPYRWVSELDAGLFHVYAPVYPLLLLATLYAWLPPAVGKLVKGRVRVRVRCRGVLKTAADCPLSGSARHPCLTLASAILLSIALPLIPYLPAINPEFRPASVDIRYYSRWLGNMLTTDHWSAIEYAFYGMRNGNRPLYLMLLYGLTSLGIPRQVVLNFEALLISPLFALAVYFAAVRLSGDRLYVSLASLAAVLGFNMTVGMFAGYFAAWTALIPFYACIALTPGLEERGLVGCLAASVAMLYIHPWTWSLLMAVLTVHLASKALGSGRLDRRLLAVLLANAAADTLKTLVSPSYGGLTSSATILGNEKRFGVTPLLDLPRSLRRLSTTYVGGLFLNPLHMLLALIGVLSLLGKRDRSSNLIVIWVALVSLVFPFSSVGLQSHLLFAAPFPILIAEGLWTLSRHLGGLNPKLPKALTAFFLVSSLTYAVRALCNLI